MSVSEPTPERYVEATSGSWHHKPLRRTPLGASPGAAVTTSQLTSVANDICALCGFAVAETTGVAAASFRLWDGNAINTDFGMRVNMAANESTREFWYPRGIEILTGRLFLQVLSGSIEGVIFWV